ncbi:MAG: LytTR family DNA-binding domain-containing protein [Paenibacillus dendritiformis]|uniref:LytR/AlgR family response regulator transcription factor n=1 Tax=Paenibacillus dendritiformis TaxID=130049 RepID=UPI00143D065B|nr:LytTR family DNA-binding domain-containing protein [Paenibacillus dendritiformis]MDU5144251.1 LytTR family DNA-binding domain-containing protein [Paenibacillus dendritiformis]NKI22471.1 response regulator transcription factor [Paenibacillus dendritiformis]NRF97511.1 response regulator transcription factor [Paenibacillus dendritiformis]
MLSVYICEDNIRQREQLERFVTYSIIKQKLDMKVALATGDYRELAERPGRDGTPALFLLDIDLKADMNGIQLGGLLRDKYPDCLIVFVTTHSELSYLTFQYKVEAFDFIMKDHPGQFEMRLEECLRKAYERHLKKGADPRRITIETDESIINVKYEDVLFFETSSSPHKIKLHERNRQIEFYGTLKELEKQLDDRFYRCHKAYIVNVNNIQEIDKLKRVVHMVNGEACYVSFRYYNGLVKAMTTLTDK